uniref:Peptidase C14 caspase domain-containing protein n=1 Tax=viral metagenome TaxID=1070528 RepID=A0A6C0DAL5_9ZZZZ
MKKRALLIGINYINNPDYGLSGCIDDICYARNMLIDAYGYNKSNIIMLRDDTENPGLMPTYENIIRELNNIVSTNSDEIWIQYSGHGTQLQNKTDKSLIDDVIVPIDFYNNYIFDSDIYKILLKIRGCAILLFDCCHSGSIGNLPWTFMLSNNSKNDTNIITINNNNTMTNPNIYLISGCKDNQTSSDAFNKELSQDVGVFSNALNECLRDSNHQIDIMTLYKNICKKIIAAGYSQRPVLSCSTNTPNYMFSRYCEPNAKINAIITNSVKENTMRNRMNSIIKNI